VPSVSVIVAAFNSEDTIADTLRSLQEQSVSDWEAFVVDDESTDSTVEVVKTFSHDSRIRLIRLDKNGGSGRARNIAVAQASSDLLMIVDADDICMPDRMQKQLDYMLGHPEVDVLGGQVAEFGDWGGPVPGTWPVTDAAISDRIRREKMPIAHCAMIIRRSAFVEAGGYDEECLRAQDFALLRKLRSKKFAAVSDILVYYRTIRPIPFMYAIHSGRYGRLARIRTRDLRPNLNAKVATFPASAPTDIRSAVTWARRRLTERSNG